MADNVRSVLEEMIPELEDLEEKGYFSRAEIRQIVMKRTNFEYLLKRRAAVKADYLRWELCCQTSWMSVMGLQAAQSALVATGLKPVWLAEAAATMYYHGAKRQLCRSTT